MRPKSRIRKLLKELGDFWEVIPDMRLGQLIGNLREDPYYIEDRELITRIKATHKEMFEYAKKQPPARDREEESK